MTQKLKVYLGSVLLDTLTAPEGGKLEAKTESSGALRVSRWFFGDPCESRQPFLLYAAGSWTCVKESHE